MTLAPPPRRRSFIAVIISGIFSSYTGIAVATQYNIAITGNEHGYEAIKTTTSDGKIVYDFQNGDSIVLSRNESAIRAGSSSDLVITSPITISNANRSSNRYAYSRSLYAYFGSISTDDLILDTTSITAVDNGYAIAVGIDATGGSIRTGDIVGHISARADSSSRVQNLQAQGLKVASSNGSIDVQGNAEFILEAINEDSASATTATNMAGAVVQNGDASTPNKLNISGKLKVSGTSSFTASSSSSYSLVSALAAYDGAAATVGSIDVDLTSVVDGTDAIAQTFGILTSSSPQGDGVASIDVGDCEISVKAEGRSGADSLVGGVWLENESIVNLGQGTIYSEAKSESGAADAMGVYVAQGTLNKKNGNITVVSDGTAYGIYAAENGTVNYEGGVVSVAASGPDYEAGIFAATGAVVNLLGDTTVTAGHALVGNGTVNIEHNQKVALNGSSESFAGVLNIRGMSAVGLSNEETSGYWLENKKAQLILPAGLRISGVYTVGTQAAGVLGKSSLTVLADGALTILVNGEFDGTSALITADNFDFDETASVNIINAAAVAEGTLVFNGTLSSLNQSVTTDNLLVRVINNKVTRLSAASAFGEDLLTPNVINDAFGTTTEAGQLINQLTHASADITSSKSMLNGIALMGVASGMQLTALNASALSSDSILSRAERLSQSDFGVGGLWVDLNGLNSRADSYSANSVTYGFKSDLAGFTLGADHKAGNDLIIGAALNAGTGSVRGQGTAAGIKNEVDYWGLNLYGMWVTDYVNLIGTLGYFRASNDVSYLTASASPEVQAYTMTVRAEKNIPLNDTYSATPHVGVRWSHLETDGFAAGGFTYSVENADIVQIPIGTAFSGHADIGGFSVKPYLDLEIAPTFGDKTTDYKVGFVGGSAQDLIDARIIGSVVWSTRIGVAAFSDAHSFGLRYGVHASNGDRVDQHLTANYMFTF